MARPFGFQALLRSNPKTLLLVTLLLFAVSLALNTGGRALVDNNLVTFLSKQQRYVPQWAVTEPRAASKGVVHPEPTVPGIRPAADGGDVPPGGNVAVQSVGDVTPLLPIQDGTFAYLVMGRQELDPKWVELSQRQPNVTVHFLAWGRKLKNFAELDKIVTSALFGTSWASGRNHLLTMAKRRETHQGWRFEFLVFWDEDARLMVRRNRTVHSADSHREAEQRLRELLLRDRPAHAGVAYPAEPQSESIPLHPLACVRSCAFDAAMDAYHRTAVDQVLPYPIEFDKVNWWMASETTSFRSAAAFPQHCTTYREIVLKRAGNAHRDYPHDQGFDWKKSVLAVFHRCMRDSGVFDDLQASVQKYGYDRDRIQYDSREECSAQAARIDYNSKLSKAQLRMRHCRLVFQPPAGRPV